MTKKLTIILVLPVLAAMAIISCNGSANSNHSENGPDIVATRKKVDMSAGEIKTLNAFFTSFSEIYTPNFSRENVSDSLLISFGVFYNFRNHSNIFTSINRGNIAGISEKQVADTAFKYLGFKIKKHQAIPKIEYISKTYLIENAIGETYRFSQIKELTDIGNGLFEATIEIFNAGSGFTGDINADSTIWKSDNEEDIPQSEGKMKAIIKKENENGNIHYVLLEYLKI